MKVTQVLIFFTLILFPVEAQVGISIGGLMAGLRRHRMMQMRNSHGSQGHAPTSLDGNRQSNDQIQNTKYYNGGYGNGLVNNGFGNGFFDNRFDNGYVGNGFDNTNSWYINRNSGFQQARK